MSVRLDPRSHADLKDEARDRIVTLLPELRADGDPAETLIELFAWMTGLATERLGRLPDKLHLELLDMLGIELRPPAPARADLRIRLSAPAAKPLTIRAGTEIGTVRTATEDSVVFHVEEDFAIAPLRPAAYVVERAGAAKEIGVADGVAHLHGPDRIPFDQPPRPGDALYLGFEQSIARLLMHVSIEASMARGAGVRPEDPPLRWEASQGQGAWTEVDVLSDRTGGFNYGSGIVEVQLPVRLRGRAARGPSPALAALPNRRHHAHDRPTRRLPTRAGDLPDHRRADRRAARRRALDGRDRRAAGHEQRRPGRGVHPSLRAGPRPRRAARRSRSRRRPGSGSRGRRSSRSPTRARKTDTSQSTWSTAKSGWARRSTSPAAAQPPTAPPSPRAPTCACRATATGADGPATSRRTVSPPCAARFPVSHR